MKNLFQNDVFAEIIERINKLTPSSKRQWGKMTIDQMLEHCFITMQTATGDKIVSRLFIGKIFGRLLKPSLVGKNEVRKNISTHPDFLANTPTPIEEKKKNLIGIIKKFHEGGEEKCTTHPHTFAGKLLPIEWAILMYKHLDHHLKQFGV
jgi:hypothetical protein